MEALSSQEERFSTNVHFKTIYFKLFEWCSKNSCLKSVELTIQMIYSRLNWDCITEEILHKVGFFFFLLLSEDLKLQLEQVKDSSHHNFSH